MRLLIITFVTLVLVGVGLLTVRFWGQGQRYAEYDLAFFESDRPYIVIPWEQNYFLEKNPEYILWADVYRGDEAVILVKPWTEREQPPRNLEKVSSPARPNLEELLKQFPQTRFVLNINDNVENIHKQVLQVIENAGAKERVMIQSDYNSILVSMKDLAPLLTYGSSPADITRLKSYQSLWILPAAPFKGDVYFAPLKIRNNIETLNPEIEAELHRRYKNIFLGPLETKEEVQQALALKADGFFLSDPLLLPSEIPVEETGP